MQIGVTSNVISNPRGTLADFVAEAQAREADGFAFVSTPHIFGLDAITACAIAGRETARIELVTGVVPIAPRHPTAIAQQALTAQAAAQGRFTLGIGLSHKLLIEDMLGLSYAQPARTMEEYLEVLAPLLRGEAVDHSGDRYRVRLGLDVPGAKRVPLIVAALGPRMLELTGRLADGTATWMTGVRTLGELTVPTLRESAKAASRPEPRVMASMPIVLTSDPAGAREVANKVFAIYGKLPSYRAMLDREGAENPGDVAIAGDEATLRAGIASLRDAGVTDLAASVFPADEGAVVRTLEFLKAEL